MLWSTGQLGDYTPQELQCYSCVHGMYFALRSGQEHGVLCYLPSQIELFEMPSERPYVNNPGGLKGRKHQQKVAVHHANEENPTRCFYKLYHSKRPPDRPKGRKGQYWYT